MLTAKEEYGRRLDAAAAYGAAVAAAAKKSQDATESRGSMRLTGQMPRIIRDNLVANYGLECFRDEEFNRDLRRHHPEMMCVDGRGVDGEHNIIGTATRFGKSSYKQVRGVWYKWTGTEWVLGEPKSKMDWSRPAAPAVL